MLRSVIVTTVVVRRHTVLEEVDSLRETDRQTDVPIAHKSVYTPVSVYSRREQISQMAWLGRSTFLESGILC